MSRRTTVLLGSISLLLLLWPWIGSSAVPARVDNLVAAIPWRSFAVASVRGGQLPLWNPHNFCGHPLLAFPATAFLYPPEWGALVFGPLLWERLNVVLHHALALVFMYRYLRRTGVWRGGALLGGVSFGIGAHLLFHIPWMRVGIPVVWLPLLLLLVEDALRRDRPVRSAGKVALATAVVLLGGTTQIALYVVGAFAAYAVAMALGRPRTLVGLFAGAVLGLIIYAGQLVPSNELRGLGDYALVSYQRSAVGALRAWQLPGAFLGGAEKTSILARVNYVGVLTLLMVPWSFRDRTMRRRVLVLLGLAFGAALLSLGDGTPLHRLVWTALPPARSFRAPSRCLFIAGTALAAVGAMGSRNFLRRRSLGADLVTAVPLIALALGLMGAAPAFAGGKTCLLIFGGWGAVGCALGLVVRRRHSRWAIAIWALLTAELFWYGMVRNRELERAWTCLGSYGALSRGHEAVPASGRHRWVGASLSAFVRDGGPWERLGVWSVPNTATLSGSFDIQGYSPLKLRRYDEFLRLVHGGARSGAVDRHMNLMLNPYSPCVDLLRIRRLRWPRNRGTLEEGLLPLVTGTTVTATRPLEFAIGPCVADSIKGVRVGADARIDETVAHRQRLATLELETTDGETWQIPLLAGVHLNAPGRGEQDAWDFPFGKWVSLTRLRVSVDSSFQGGIRIRNLAVRASPAGWARTREEGGVLTYERRGQAQEAVLFPEPNAVFVDGPDEASQRMRSHEFDPRTQVVLEGTPQGRMGTGVPGAPVAARITGYGPRRVVISTESSVDGFLFLADAYYPGWRALVDGRGEAILPADVAFRAVRVPAGRHTVVMEYAPHEVRFGLWVSGCGLVLAVGLILVGNRRRGGSTTCPD